MNVCKTCYFVKTGFTWVLMESFTWRNAIPDVPSGIAFLQTITLNGTSAVSVPAHAFAIHRLVQQNNWCVFTPIVPNTTAWVMMPNNPGSASTTVRLFRITDGNTVFYGAAQYAQYVYLFG